jgi:hypothetical protein
VAVGLGLEWQERARLDAAREERAIQAEEAERRDAAPSQAFLLPRHAGEGRPHQQVLDDARSAFARAERIAARKERQELELEGKPIPEHLQLKRHTMQREAAEREKAKADHPGVAGRRVEADGGGHPAEEQAPLVGRQAVRRPPLSHAEVLSSLAG